MDSPKALIVDDEPTICRACEKILSREGYSVKIAYSGKQALSLLDQESFDILFTDLKMAEMGGMELLETVRSRFPDLVPIVITGFEPLDLAQGVLMAVRQLEAGTCEVQNGYPRAVTFEGNKAAQALIQRVLQPVARNWRGIGMIPHSGWGLRPEYAAFDAENRFNVRQIHTQENAVCIAGQILQGLKKPAHCPAFASPCTPQNPLGAPMVSSEGACNA